jgi:hypothetical protein
MIIKANYLFPGCFSERGEQSYLVGLGRGKLDLEMRTADGKRNDFIEVCE